MQLKSSMWMTSCAWLQSTAFACSGFNAGEEGLNERRLLKRILCAVNVNETSSLIAPLALLNHTQAMFLLDRERKPISSPTPAMSSNCLSSAVRILRDSAHPIWI